MSNGKTIRAVFCDRIDEAKTDDDIRTAYQEMLIDSDNNVELLNHNLGYMLGYYDKETRENWYIIE